MPFADRVRETSTTTGTGDITTAGASVGYRTFNTAFGMQVRFDYVIQAVDGSGVPTGDWEVGSGYLSGATTLVRNVVYASSNSGALVSFAAGTKDLFCSLPAVEIQTGGQIIAMSKGQAML